MEKNIKVENIGKYFGHIKAVDGVSFNVEKGEVLGFLGPNGAGKSTTMKMLTCFVTPTFGSAKICGYDILNDSTKVRQAIGYLPESAATYSEMTVTAFLRFVAELRGFDGKDRTEKVERIEELANLQDVVHQEIETLSKGYKRRVALAQALLHDPPVLIMDEPTDGLDPNQKQEVRDLIKKLAKEKVIILSTHILEEVEAVCTRAIIIANGKIVADSSPDELRQRSTYRGAVDVTLRSDTAQGAEEVLSRVSGVRNIQASDLGANKTRYLIFPEKGRDIAHEVSRTLYSRNWIIESFSVEKGRLDQVFRSITQGGASV